MTTLKGIAQLQRKLLGLFLLVTFMTPAGAFAQSAVPEEYRRDEFPRWALDLRRFETILIGSLPFTLMVSGLGADYYLYYVDGVSPDSGPWPIGEGLTLSKDDKDRKNNLMLTVGISLSAVIAIADMIVFKVKNRNKE